MDFLLLGSFGVVFVIVSYLFAKRKLRPLFPVKVNCWFCNHDTSVPYGNRNCWDCPNCEQYNGFEEDGDYNKPVPAQYLEDLNHPVSCDPSEFLSRNSFLCPKCQRNQLLKVKQLSTFEPLNESTYDEELAFYQRHLESVYALCSACDSYVKMELKKIDDTLHRQPESSDLLPKSALNGLLDHSYVGTQGTVSFFQQINVSKFLHWMFSLATTFCSMYALSSAVYQQWPNASLVQLYGKVDYFTDIELAMLGLCCCMLAKLLLGKGRLLLRDAAHILLWLATLLFSVVASDLPFLPVNQFLLGLLAVLVFMELCIGLTRRHPTNVTRRIIKRLSLEGQNLGTGSDAVSDAVSSVTTSCHRSRNSQLGDSGDGLEVSPLRINTGTNQNRVVDKESDERKKRGGSVCRHIDGLGNDLGSFLIGSPCRSDSGTTSSRSSVFSTGLFGPPSTASSSTASSSTATATGSQTGLSAGLQFPRPLISPARLQAISFSPSAVSGTQKFGVNQSGQSSLFSTAQSPSSSGHHNPFLEADSRPLSMFQEKNEGSRPLVYHKSPSQFYGSVDRPSLFSACLDHPSPRSAKTQFLGSPPYRKASSDVAFSHGSTLLGTPLSAELFSYRGGFYKGNKASSEIDFPAHGHRGEFNLNKGKASSEVDFPLHGNRPSFTTSKSSSSQANFPLHGMKPSFTSSLNSWWRNSSSDLYDHRDDETCDKQHKEEEEEYDRETPARENTFCSSKTSYRGDNPFSECDSTTPELSGLKLEGGGLKFDGGRKKKGRRKEMVRDSFDFSDDSGEEEGGSGVSMGRSSGSTLAYQQRRDRSSWMSFAVGLVVIVSVATNLFLTWTVWGSR